MRVAYVCGDSGVPVFGRKGCSVHVQAIVDALLRRGADVALVAASRGGEPRGSQRKVRLLDLPAVDGGDARSREVERMRANEATACLLRGLPGQDLVYERFSLFQFSGMQAAREQGICGVLEVNAPLVEEQARHRTLIREPEARIAMERAFEAARIIVAVSEGIAQYLSAFEACRGKVHVVPNGVDLSRFTPAVEPREPRELTIGFVGSLKPWHGLDDLITAFSLVRRRRPDVRLLIIGDGPERARIASRIESLGLTDAAILVGGVEPLEVPKLLRQVDVAAVPYPAEGADYFSPLKLFESMAAGLPIVATAGGQASDVLTDGIDGLLVPPGDTRGLADAFDRLASSPGLRQRLGAAARERAEQAHGWDGVLERILSLAGVV